MSVSNEMRIVLADNEAGTTNAIAIAGIDCDLNGDRVFGRDPGSRGTRQQYACGARVLSEDVTGGFTFQPSEAELDWFIERMIGDNITAFPGSAAIPMETLPSIYAFVDKGVQNFRYDKLRLASLTLSIQEGDYVTLRPEFLGETETQDVAWPVGAPDPVCEEEFIAADCALNIAATGYSFKSLNLSIDNGIVPGQRENSVTRTIFETDDLAISMDAVFGVRTDTVALYRRAIAGDAGNLVLANSDATYTFTFGNLKIPTRGPTVPAQGEITKNLRLDCFRTAGANQVSIAKS